MGIERLALVLGLALLVYLAAVRLPRLRWIPTRVIGIVAVLGLLASIATGPSLGAAAPPLRAIGPAMIPMSFICASWAIGRAVRERREYRTRTAEEFAARAVAEERLRIARELHDIVAHHLSLITVKAGVAAHVAAARPDEVPDSLRVIERTSREALNETRHLLDLLRTGASDDDLAPTPTIGQLPALIESARTAGVAVELELAEIDDLPDEVGRSVYRIVQEAVTNVVRHAAPARCRVRVDRRPGAVRIEVSDDGTAAEEAPEIARPMIGRLGAGRGQRAGTTGPGHGLIGMRERVALHGGEFEAGPRTDGGFKITAVLPYVGRGEPKVAAP